MQKNVRKINPIGSTLKNASRLKEIVSVFARHGFENLAERARLGRFVIEKLTRHDLENLSVPERLRLSFEELGPTFVKLGQLLATRPDLLPADFCEEFKKLHDQVTTLPFEKMKPQIENHFEKPMETIFQSFDPQPIGAASIAQVYQAVLRTGEPVVVKVQRPGIVDVIYKDLNVIYTLAELLDAYVPETRIYNPRGIVDEFFKTLSLETNFVVEANNMRKFQENFKKNEKIKIPKVYHEFTGEKVLVMEKLKGLPFSSPQALQQEGLDTEELIKTGIQCYYQMVFKDGFFHGDMHPGNLFVLDDGRLGLIDFGVVGRLNPKTQSAITSMLIALATEDYDRLAYEYVDLAPYNEHVDVDAVSRQVRDLIAPYYGLNIGEVNTGKLLLESTSVAAENNLVLPSELVMFFKSIINIESLGKMIRPDFDVLKYSLDFIKEIAQHKYESTKMAKELGLILRDSQSLLQTLPRSIKQMIRKWNSPDYKTKIQIEELPEIRYTLYQSSSLIFLGLIITGLILSSSLIVAWSGNSSLDSVPAIAVVGYVIAVFLGFLAFINYIKR